ncbi:aminoacyl-tRNA hydrolase [Pseudohoeflea coraliihabitans]|uniref:Peptidyl-tRNA hydrolase n=1 Tax=Pseudohoeflea coraliihabitans TaxID=2860393 RepID=A0ABS6WJI7_9HYPH|nr:aminoacyl-tRNA hydrolase [Pseudohoeflea sp. DP4N28-3]MBW3096107.1 aminoacyl-tRNA hydrolase [Pseudohoeflea sp. DP4N28-3]
MMLIAGLGNPGAKYESNRHNVGFMAADAIARRHSFSPWSRKFRGEIAEGTLGGDKVLLLKPMTFMNASGEAIGEAMRFYKLQPENLFVLHDELDLAPGRVRVKTGGSHGGHNGLKSADSHCGNAYHRLRIGIGHPGDKARVHNYVLGNFSKADNDWLDPLLDAIADHVELLLDGQTSSFLNKLTLATREADLTQQPAQEPAPKSARKGGGQSHIRQARTSRTIPAQPERGPMAEMLRKLFGSKDG